MIDPAMVELTTYNSIPHLLSPVVVDWNALCRCQCWRPAKWTDAAVCQRGRVTWRHNAKAAWRAANRFLPYIILVIDELADLMMSAPDDVERAARRLAQMSRHRHSHLILATQRPSVDVVTGLIKANFRRASHLPLLQPDRQLRHPRHSWRRVAVWSRRHVVHAARQQQTGTSARRLCLGHGWNGSCATGRASAPSR